MISHEILPGVRVGELDRGGRLVELRGEFDLHNLEGLREVLKLSADSRAPTFVDLSGVTFADGGTVLELAVHALLYPGRVLLRNPSRPVLRTAEVCGLSDWPVFGAEPAGSSEGLLAPTAGRSATAPR